jgi:N-acyl-D-amino-acid deacylase
VGIRGATIAGVGSGLEGHDEIECDGHVIAPGFIDTHSHSDVKALMDPTLPMKLRQGITLEILGQDGISVAPVRSEERRSWKQKLAGLLGDFGVVWDWSSTGDYLDRLAAMRPAQDMAYLAPHGCLRQQVMGSVARPASADEITAMAALLAESLAQGACGMSTGLIYPPCCFAETEELVALGRVLAAASMPLVVHMRNESDRVLEAADEMLHVAEASRCAVHISHLKLAGRRNWDRVGALLSRFESARERGLRVTADQYPYIAGSTLLSAVLPPWAHEGGLDATLARLADPEARQRMRQELTDISPCGWDNFWSWGGPEGITITDIPSGHHPELVGMHIAQAAFERRKDPVELTFDLLLEERLGVAMICFSQDESVVRDLMARPYVNICTDGLLGGRPHPRAYGSYPRILGRYVREGVLSLEEAVRKMTFQAAVAFGLTDVGLVREGQRANLVVFDPETVEDRATYGDPMQFPVGIRDVLVGGTVVVRREEITGARPGRVLRSFSRA